MHNFLLFFLLVIAFPSHSEIDLFELSLEELFSLRVTANKRDELVYDTPLALSAPQGEQLQSWDTYSLLDVANFIPGLNYGRLAVIPNLYIRGIGSELIGVGTESSVAVYQDGVYLARPEMAMTSLWDVQRLEIVRGPQGTLYGRNSTAGNINIISRTPDFNKSEASGILTAGNFDRYQFNGVINQPLNQHHALRGAVLMQTNSGYTLDKDPIGGKQIDNMDNSAARFQWQADVFQTLEVLLNVDWQQQRTDGFSAQPLDNLGLADQQGAVPEPDYHVTRNNIDTFVHFDSYGAGLDLKGEYSRWQWSSLTAYREMQLDYFYNTDGTEIDVSLSDLRWDQKQWSQEFHISSGQLDDGIWLFGLYGFWEEASQDVAIQRTPANTSILLIPQIDTQSMAAFIDWQRNLHPKWRLNLGLRYSYERKEDSNVINLTNDDLGFAGNVAAATELGTIERAESWDEFTPKMVLSLRPNDSNMTYLSISQGFKSGGMNSLSLNEPFDPEVLWSYELGYRYHSEDRKTRMDITAFIYDYTDLQVSVFENNLVSVRNAASAEVKGVELFSQYQFQKKWNISGALHYLDARYKDFQLDESTQLKGNHLPFAPQWESVLTLQHHGKVLGGELASQFNLTYRDVIYFDDLEDQVLSEGSLSTLNISTDWSSHDQQWRIGLAGKNLTDQDYLDAAVRFSSTSAGAQANALGYPAAGRTVSIRFQYLLTQ